jgi:site-specific DNA recombinase
MPLSDLREVRRCYTWLFYCRAAGKKVSNEVGKNLAASWYRKAAETHTNKNGVRYLYYVSQAALRKESPPGSIARGPGPELEALVIDVLRRHLQANGSDPKPISETDRELIERHLLRVTLSANEVKVHLRAAVAGSDPAIGNDDPIVAGNAEATIAIPWTVSTATLVKGLAYVPAHNTPMKPGSREVLLMAIAKARKWIKDIDRGQSFVDIARREGKAERHVRHLAPLAFVSPRIITAIIDGTVPAGLTTMALAKRMPYSWTEQEQPQRLECAVQNGT